MRAILTGQIGLDKNSYLTKLVLYAKKRKTSITSYPIGQRIIHNTQGRFNEKTILNAPQVLLEILRRWAWDSSILEVEKNEAKNPSQISVVNTHAVFRWHHGMFPSIDMDLFLRYNPEVVFTLIGSIDEVKKGIQDRETDFLELWELFAWREEEIVVTSLLCQTLNHLRHKDEKKIKHYVIAKEQGAELMYKILTEPDKMKIYMSFASTGNDAQKDAEIDSFKKRVVDEFIAFDPLAIGEKGSVTKAISVGSEIEEDLSEAFKTIMDMQNNTSPGGDWSIKWDEFSSLCFCLTNIEDLPVEGRQIVSVLKAIDNQIVSRDYILIDQSDVVLMYILTDSTTGKPIISAGSQSEMLYAYSHGKPVFVVCCAGKSKLSPWVTQFCKVFESTEEAIEQLSKYEQTIKGK